MVLKSSLLATAGGRGLKSAPTRCLQAAERHYKRKQWIRKEMLAKYGATHGVRKGGLNALLERANSGDGDVESEGRFNRGPSSALQYP